MTTSNFSKWFLLLAVSALLVSATSFAATYDFEDGTDAQVITSTHVPGIVFEPTLGRQWTYGDWRTGKYDGAFPTGPYFSDGNFFAWMGIDGDIGKISFPEGASRFALGYSSPDLITLEGYDSLGTMVASQTGDPNLNSGEMGLLQVEAQALSYIRIGVGSMGNYWIVDNIETDAIAGCLTAADCDDGVFCNGPEQCVDGECAPGEPPDCGDDGLFCNGDEFCDEAIKACGHQNPPACSDDGQFCNGDEVCDEDTKACGHSGDPCTPGEECDEVRDMCTLHGETDDDTAPPADPAEEGWPEGKVTGGCCGCQ